MLAQRTSSRQRCAALIGALLLLSTGVTIAGADVIVFTSPITINAGDTTYDGHDIVVDGTTVTINGPHAFASLHVTNNGVVTHSPNTNAKVNFLDLTITGDLAVDAGSSINITGKGYSGTNGPGAGQSSGSYSASGGGYGGKGGSGSSSVPGGAAYGDVRMPEELGSGGGRTNGGAGGGVLRLSVTGTLTVDGQLTANGANGTSFGGGGSGGSIWLEVGTLAGTGTISANGGAGQNTSYNGGGGGGRISITYDQDDFSGTCIARGGTPAYNFGGAGTIYRRSGREAIGELWIFNGGLANAATTPVLTADDFEMVRVGQGARVDLSDDEIFTADLLRVEDGGYVYIQTTANFAAVVVLSGGLIGHFAGDTGFALNVQGDLHIESGGRITADACGHGAASGPGAGQSSGSYSASGGGYGGRGGNGSSSLSGGATYGDVRMPEELGSGGGRTNGGAGGGVLRLSVTGTLTVDGQLTANGANGTSFGGGGSGGSIWLEVGTLAGTGTISANGGAGAHTAHNGGGGGGRISITYDQDDFSGTCIARGGTPAYNFGGAGTIYRGSGRQAVGELWIFNGGLANAATTPAVAADDFEIVRVAQGARVNLSGDEIFTADLLRVEDGGYVYIQTTANFAAVVVLSGGLIGHFAGDTGFALSVQGDLHIESGGRITADACGHGPASGPGAGQSSGSYSASGGGYGGNGGNGSSSLSGGAAYGDPMRPVWLGSGGGRTNGGAGGGVLRLSVAGTLTVDGQLTANGANGTNYGGGGSGGSIFLEVGTLAGTGTIAANGGAGAHTAHNGGGGGGRIAIYSCDIQMSTSLINATGGTGYDNGEDGTIEFGSSTVNITLQPTPQILRFGDPATLHVAATGIGKLSYQWRRNYQPLENDDNYSGVNTDTLSIDAFAVDAIGLYDVVVTDDCGPFTSDYAMLTIPADLDRDGDVDLADLAQLLGHYGTTGGALPEHGDIDGDGDVDISDLADLLGHYGIGT